MQYDTVLFLSDQRHIYINRQSYREAVDVGNKVISQNVQHRENCQHCYLVESSTVHQAR